MRQILAVFVVVLVLAGCVTTGGSTKNKTSMAEGYFMKGLSHMQEKNYELASVEFNRSIQTDNDNKKSYYMLGLISDHRGKYDEAIDYFKEAIGRDSLYSEAYNAMGATYSKQKKWKEALKAYNRALENKLYTTPHLPYVNIGRLYMEQKEYDKAIEAYRDAKRYAKQDFIIYELGTAFMESGKTKDAISEFREGVEMSPRNADFRYSLAGALLKQGNKKEAIAEYKKAAELAPGTETAAKAKQYIKTLR